jgi:heat shock protein HslJ
MTPARQVLILKKILQKDPDMIPPPEHQLHGNRITAVFLAVKGFIIWLPDSGICMQPGKKNSFQHIFPLLGGAGILIFFILAAGCTGQEPGSGLNDNEWLLTGYVLNDTATPVLSATAVTLAFGTDGRISGRAGCNGYFASSTIKGSTIAIGQAGSTMMYCSEPGVMDQESTYLSLLSQAATFTIEGNSLFLFNGKGTKILSFAKVIPPEPKPLTGTNWTLESVHTGQSVSSVISESSMTAVFEKDGRVSGSAGCNRYFAGYNLTGTKIFMSGIGSTKMACAQPGVMNQETLFLHLLSATRSYTIEGNLLSLLDENGGPVLTFRAGI